MQRTEEFHEKILQRPKYGWIQAQAPNHNVHGIPSHTSYFVLLMDFLRFFVGEYSLLHLTKQNSCLLTNFWFFHYVSYLLIPLSGVQAHPPTLVPRGYLSTAPFPHNLVTPAASSLTQELLTGLQLLRLVILQVLVSQSRTLRPRFSNKAVIHIPQQTAIPP